MIYFTKASELIGATYPQLDVCTNNGSPLMVLQWQCGGEITIDAVSGVSKTDPLFIEKARKFIQLALTSRAGLVLTPEYSFPYQVLDELIADSTRWPAQGKLWCFGSQGDNRDSFLNRLREWSGIANVIVIDLALGRLENNSFVSPLFYLFTDTSNRLIVIPQFKTGSMADPRSAFEGPGLCRGFDLVIIDDAHTDCHNVFLSLICADILHITYDEIRVHLQQKAIILFHPQLNYEPRHQDMLSFRQGLLNLSNEEVRIITLNWSDNTYGQFSANTIRFYKPWSAFFKHNNLSLLEPSFRNNKDVNHKKGTAFVLDDHTEIWFSHRYEHCKLMLISKGDNGDHRRVVTHRDEPNTIDCLTFDTQSGNWIPYTDSCSSNIQTVFNSHPHAFSDFPFPVCHCNPGHCDHCKYTDYFYGSFFGKFEDSEIKSHNESINRLLVAADKESDDQRLIKVDLLLNLRRMLDTGVLPKSLQYLYQNINYNVNRYFPDQGVYQYNLVPLNPPYHSSEALAVITDALSMSKVESQVTSIFNKLHEEYQRQLLVYYKLPGGDYRYFDKHLQATSIKKPAYTTSLSSMGKSSAREDIGG